MLTLVESISLAGDRAKQNDDAQGFARGAAWVIDGATDLHDAPLTGAASDAAWIAETLNAYLHQHAGAQSKGVLDDDRLRALVRDGATSAVFDFAQRADAPGDKWKSPICSVLLAAETERGVIGLDLGDCRCFVLDATGNAQAIGGPPAAPDLEAKLAAKAKQDAGGGPLLRHAGTLDMLRRARAFQNGGGGSWTFCLDPRCAEEARVWEIALARPAHLLLASDGFSALADRYGLYDAASLVQAARAKGLQELGRALRALEIADQGGARHPRFKPSDDATALLIRLS